MGDIISVDTKAVPTNSNYGRWMVWTKYAADNECGYVLMHSFFFFKHLALTFIDSYKNEDLEPKYNY